MFLSGEESLMKSFMEDPLFFKDNKNLPVYKWGLKKGIPTEKAAAILVNGCSDTRFVASAVPSTVDKNVVFLVDSTALVKTDDIKCDDLGSWLVTGSKKSIFEKKEDLSVQLITEEMGSSHGKRLFLVHRLFYKNKSLPSLRKSVVTAINLTTDKQQPLVLVQYIFSDGEQSVLVKSHGNLKASNDQGRPYKRTMKSTKEWIKVKLSKHSPRKVTHDIIGERGGMQNIQSAGEFPRDRTQIYNVKRNLSIPKSSSSFTKDPLLDVLVKAKEDQSSRKDAFIRDIPMFPEPVVFLTTDQQLKDVERFCTNPESFSELGVDATFQIADYYFTFVTYQNLLLETKKGRSHL